MFKTAKKFMATVVPGVLKPLQVVWNQVIGFIFLVFALLSAKSVYHAIVHFNGRAEDIFKVALTVLFALIMTFFGVASFLRARKISKS
jgi:hypothetical protein